MDLYSKFGANLSHNLILLKPQCFFAYPNGSLFYLTRLKMCIYTNSQQLTQMFNSP